MNYLTSEQENILNECRELLRQHEIVCTKEDLSSQSSFDESDEIYERYWHLIHDNFNIELLKEVEKRIYYGKFMDEIYIDTLVTVINEVE